MTTIRIVCDKDDPHTVAWWHPQTKNKIIYINLAAYDVGDGIEDYINGCVLQELLCQICDKDKLDLQCPWDIEDWGDPCKAEVITVTILKELKKWEKKQA